MTSTLNKAIKQILKEIDHFLSVTLKDQTLNKTSTKERNDLLDSLQRFYNDHAELRPDSENGDRKSSSVNPRLSTVGSQFSEDGECNENIPQTTVSALKDHIKAGYLLQRKIGSDKKGFKLKKDPKKYCVVHQNVMYWFVKPSDKTYHGAVFLNGCELRDMSRKEKEFVFQLDFISGNRLYEFQADNKQDLEGWKSAVESGIKCGEEKAANGEDPYYIDAMSLADAMGKDSTDRPAYTNHTPADDEQGLYELEPNAVPSVRDFKIPLQPSSSIPRESAPDPPKKEVVLLPLPKKGKTPKEPKPAKKEKAGKEKQPKNSNDKTSSQSANVLTSKFKTLSDVKLKPVSLPVDEYKDDTELYLSVDEAAEAITQNDGPIYEPMLEPPTLPQRNQDNTYVNQPDSDDLVYEIV